MATILDEIVEYKRGFVTERMISVPMDQMIERASQAPRPRSLFDRLAESDDLSVIAEIKKASPSKGLIREDFNPVDIGTIYEANGGRVVAECSADPRRVLFEHRTHYLHDGAVVVKRAAGIDGFITRE